MATKNPPTETPSELHMFLTTKMPDCIAKEKEVALAYLYDIPNPDREDFSSILKKNREQMEINITLLKEFLVICQADKLVTDIDEFFDKSPEYKAFDELKYRSSKARCSKVKGHKFSERHLDIRIMIVQILSFPDNEYEKEEREIIMEYFELPPRVREGKTLLSAFIYKEQHEYDKNDIWVAFDLLIFILNEISRRESSKKLDSLIRDCIKRERNL